MPKETTRVLSSKVPPSTWPRRKSPAAPFTTSFWEPAKWKGILYSQPMLYPCSYLDSIDPVKQANICQKTSQISPSWNIHDSCINMSVYIIESSGTGRYVNTWAQVYPTKKHLRSFTSEHTEASLLRLQIQSLPPPIPKDHLFCEAHQTQAQIRKSQTTLYTITHLDIFFFQLRYQYKAIKHHPKRHLLIEGHLLQDPNLGTNKNIGSRWNFSREKPLGKPDVSSASSIGQGDTWNS